MSMINNPNTLGPGPAKRAAAAAMSDTDLRVAYDADAAARDFGVDYYLAQEMEKRGFRAAKTDAEENGL